MEWSAQVRAHNSGGVHTLDDADMARWRDLGACRGLDPGVFYPDTDEEAEMAKSVCAECDVRLACLEYALNHREKQGVWGGATERERRRIIRQRRRTA